MLYGVWMWLVFNIKWVLLAGGGACLWVGLGPLTAFGAWCLALAVMWEVWLAR